MSFKANVNAAYDNTTIIGTDTNRFRENATAFVYNNSFEFKDSMKQANEYTYDANGNLTKDLNKNITGISYNCLNLPNTVTFSEGRYSFRQTELYVSGNIQRGEKENTADREMRRRMQTADFHEPAVPIIIYE